MKNKSEVLTSVIIPAYNEEDVIERTIAEVKKLDINKEIIVIDDGSKDNTVGLVKKIDGIRLVEHGINKGRGAAIKTGIQNSMGDVICTQDADMEQKPVEIPRLIQPIIEDEADCVYGSRFSNKKNFESSTWLRIVGNKFFALLGNILFHYRLTDVYTGSKCYSKRVFENLSLDSDGFEQEVEILAKLSRHRMRVLEIPIDYQFRTSGASKMKFKDGLVGFYVILKYFFKMRNY